MSDDAVFRAALDHDDRRSAAAWLVETYAKDVLSLCRAMVTDPTLAEDLTQDAFHKALGGLATFRGEASARTWLLTIARHRCVDHLRRNARRPDRPDEPFDEASGEASDDSPLAPDLISNRASVAQALEILDESSRALVVLRYHHGLEYAELADAYGLKPGAVRMRVSRAVAAMRAALTTRADAALGGSVRGPVAGATPSPARRRARRPVPPGAPAAAAPSAPQSRGSGAGAPPPPPQASAPRAARPAPLRRGDGTFGSVLGELQALPSTRLTGRLDALVDAL